MSEAAGERRENRKREAEMAEECLRYMEEWKGRLERVVKEEKEAEQGVVREIRRRLERVRGEERRRGQEEREKMVAEGEKMKGEWKRKEGKIRDWVRRLRVEKAEVEERYRREKEE